MIDGTNAEITIQRQCDLLGLSRSVYYYTSLKTNERDIALKNKIDEIYTRSPFYGVRRITASLRRLGNEVNHKKVSRLMHEIGIEAIYPKPRLSVADHTHGIYPYLLSGVVISHPNQVWCSDITYIRLKKGFVYLVAIMDWFSRFVLSWELSNSLEARFCRVALDKALLLKCHPEIFNTDQGSQFTSDVFLEPLRSLPVKISMDGRGRVFDNIFIERLWRSLKYEEVYLKDYETVPECREGIARWFQFYNHDRLHQSLGYRPPSEIYMRASP